MNPFLSQILISKIAVISPAARSKGLMGLKDNQKTKLGVAFTVCLFFLKAGGEWVHFGLENTTIIVPAEATDTLMSFWH